MLNELEQLNLTRQTLQHLKDERDALLAAVTETETFKGLELAIKTASDHEKELYETISEAAEREAIVNDTRFPFPGVEVKWVQRVKYEPKAALEYAMHNMTSVLTLDLKKFESAVKAGVVPETIAVLDQEPKAYISRDLSKFLELNEEEK